MGTAMEDAEESVDKAVEHYDKNVKKDDSEED
jgi:hypothetical protein